MIVSLSPVLKSGQPPDTERLRCFAEHADRSGFDLLLLGYDGFPLEFEPLTIAAALSGVTRRIGLCAAVTTALGEPFTVARGLAALDHLSRGRAAWQVCVDAPELAEPYNYRAALTKTEQDQRAREFVQVVFELWESWEADWLTFDTTTAEFSDPDKVHPIDHEGPFFRVRGPLNTPRPRQGRPVVVQTGDLDESWVARTADLMILRGDDLRLRDSAERYRSIEGKRGRPLRLLAEASLATAETSLRWATECRLDGIHVLTPIGDLDALGPLTRGSSSAGGTLRERLGLSL
jgi:alkanesulfonate monooxygenase SsuD/methylene tetrahydromethanopterin reductase-like flavin-dependent oxidoreductase (luciferase family)